MITDVEKTTPSEDVLMAWLAGIVDGEGTVGVYHTHSRNKNTTIFNLTIVNSDLDILKKVEFILEKFDIFYSRWEHNNKNPKGFTVRKKCYAITVRRRDDFEIVIKLLKPFLIGKKRLEVQKALDYLSKNPRKMQPVYFCKFCKNRFIGRKRQYCSLICWHNYAKADNNPNFRHGNYIARND